MRRATAIIFGLGLAAWLVSAMIGWSAGALGHDEAQYAIAAQDWLAGAPMRWIYLSYGMNVVAAPGVLAGGGEQVLRILPLLLGVGFVLAAAQLARTVASARTAAWLVATLAGTLSIAKRSAELLSDLPAAGCLLVALALIIDELDRESGPRWRVVWTAPLLAAAFYLRYGSCIPIAAIGIAAIGFGWRSIARRPLPALATLALLAALLVPHIVLALRETGRPLGIMVESTTVIGSGIGSSLVVYLTSNPFAYYGFTAPILAAGIAAIAQIRDRRRAFLWAVALLDLVGVGMTPTPQPRYIVTAIALFALLGIDAVERIVATRPPRVRQIVAALAAIGLAAAWIETMFAVHRGSASATERYGTTLRAAEAIRRDAAGQPCEVICRHTAQLSWYTGCEIVFDATPATIHHARLYIVIEPHLDHQPDLDGLAPPKLVKVLDDPAVSVTRVDP